MQSPIKVIQVEPANGSTSTQREYGQDSESEDRDWTADDNLECIVVDTVGNPRFFLES